MSDATVTEELVFQSFADIEIKARPERPPVDPAWLAGIEDAVHCLECDFCTEPMPVESVHVLPNLMAPPTAVRFACEDHDPGGYHFPLWGWTDGPPDWHDRSRPYTRRDHLLDTKVHGEEAVAMVDAAILAREGAGEWDGPANVGSNPWLEAIAPIACHVCGEFGTREFPGELVLCDNCKPPCARCGKPAEVPWRYDDEPEDVVRWACAGCRRQMNAAPMPTKLRVLDTFALVTTEPPPLDWLAEGVFTRGKLSMPGGREKVGKSMLAMAIAVAMASGGGTVAGIPVKAGVVIGVDAENGEREIHRRLRGMGLAPAHAANYVAVEARGFDLRADLGHLTALVDTYGPALLLLDSFRALWTGDERDEAQVAAALDPLRALAHDRDIAIGLLHHARKGGDEYRGSTAIGAAVEWVVMLSREREDTDRTRRRLSNPLARFAPEREDRWLSIRSDGDDGAVTLAKAEAFVPERDHPVRDTVALAIAGALKGPMTVAAIATAIGRDPKDRTVRDALKDMAERGMVTKTDAGWCPVSASCKGEDTSTPPFESQNGHHDHERMMFDLAGPDDDEGGEA